MYVFIQDGTHNLKFLVKQAQVLPLINIVYIFYGYKIIIWFWFGTGLRIE